MIINDKINIYNKRTLSVEKKVADDIYIFIMVIKTIYLVLINIFVVVVIREIIIIFIIIRMHVK